MRNVTLSGAIILCVLMSVLQSCTDPDAMLIGAFHNAGFITGKINKNANRTLVLNGDCDTAMWYNERYFYLRLFMKSMTELRKTSCDSFIFISEKRQKLFTKRYFDTFDAFYSHLAECEKRMVYMAAELQPDQLPELNEILRIVVGRMYNLGLVPDTSSYRSDFIYHILNVNEKTSRSALDAMYMTLEYIKSPLLKDRDIRGISDTARKCRLLQ